MESSTSIKIGLLTLFLLNTFTADAEYLRAESLNQSSSEILSNSGNFSFNNTKESEAASRTPSNSVLLTILMLSPFACKLVLVACSVLSSKGVKEKDKVGDTAMTHLLSKAGYTCFSVLNRPEKNISKAKASHSRGDENHEVSLH